MAFPDRQAGASNPAETSIRVLIVDDSAFMRFTISKRLNETAGIQVVGSARNGEEALVLIASLNPDVVTMDVEMPGMDGLATLREIMASHPRPVIMLSSLTSEGANETIQALTLGAVDFIAKPGSKANIDAIMDEVVSKIRRAARTRINALGGAIRAEAVRPVTATVTPFGKTARPSQGRPFRSDDRVVVIGSSTGGPRALNTVIPAIAQDLPATFLVVQHMPVGFTRSLAERLDSVSRLSVKEAAAGDRLEAGRALLAPGGYHMTVDGSGQIALNQNPAVHGVRPAVDVTMSSVAQYFGAVTIGVILTGMGSDGTNGAALIHSAGGKVIAEDESTCVVWGMPRSVVERGVADWIVPLPEVAAAIEKAIRS